MKQLINKYVILLSLVNLLGCAPSNGVAPSQNDALNSISSSSSKKKNDYFLQKQVDTYIDDELTPTVSQDKEIQEKYMQKKVDKESGEVTYEDKKGKSFTLQEMVDKITANRKVHPADHNNSNVHKLESMPVIGK